MMMMNTLQAKDFLVQQTVEQAALKHVPFSDLERRMMYFTESGDCPEDPIVLNDAFEAEYDCDEYEAKISRLLQDAHKRLKQDSPQAACTWDEAVEALRKGDHYLLVLLGDFRSTFSLRQPWPNWSFWKLLGLGLLLLTVFLVFIALMLHRADSLPGAHHTPVINSSFPSWLRYTLLGAMVGSYLCFALFPKQIAKAFDWLMGNNYFRFNRSKGNK